MEDQHLPTGILCDQLASTAATSLKQKITLCGKCNLTWISALKRGSQKHSPDPSRVQKCRNLGWISAKKTANMGKHMSCRVAQVRRSGQRKKCQASRPRNSKQKASRPTRGFAECLVSVLHQENPHLKVGYFLDGCSVLPFCIKTIKF